jgi:hypothetical protein
MSKDEWLWMPLYDDWNNGYVPISREFLRSMKKDKKDVKKSE